MPQTQYGNVLQERLNQVRNLANQWEQIAGYTFDIPDWMISNIAGDPSGINTLYQFGQYISGQVVSGTLTSAVTMGGMMPWIWFGMSAPEYHAKVEGYESSYQRLTGQALSTGVLDLAMRQHQGAMTSTQFETWLTAQDSIKQQYGWLKYGIDFQQFQVQKLQMRQQFGTDLSDQQAVVQLQYLHSAQGPDKSVSMTPTLTQIEKKQANVGVAQSEVR